MWRKSRNGFSLFSPTVRSSFQFSFFFLLTFFWLFASAKPVLADAQACDQVRLELKHFGQSTGTAQIYVPHLIITQAFLDANPGETFSVIYDTPLTILNVHEFGSISSPQDFRLIETNDIIQHLQVFGLTDKESPKYTTPSLNFSLDFGTDSPGSSANQCQLEATYSPSQLYVFNEDIDTGENPEGEEVEEPPLPDFSFCNQVPGDIGDPTSERARCVTCLQSGQSDAEGQHVSGTIYTALGCIRTDQQGLLRDIVKLLLGVAGMAALLAILAGSFQYTTSQGDSNKVKEAKELITAAVTGLFFMIFSIIILDFVGVQLFQIPGLSQSSTEQGPGNQPPITQCASAGQSQTSDRPCCDRLIPDGPTQICRAPELIVTGSVVQNDDNGINICLSSSSSNAEALNSVSGFFGSASCRGTLGNVSCNMLPTTNFGQLGPPFVFNGYERRCTPNLQYASFVGTAFRGFIAQKLGSHLFAMKVTQRAEQVYYYDVEVTVDKEIWDNLFSDIQQELQATNQFQIEFHADYTVSINGENLPLTTGGFGYATMNLTVTTIGG